MAKKGTLGKAKIPAADEKTDRANVAANSKKRARSDNNEETSKENPTQVATRADIKNKSARLSGKAKLVGRSRVQIVEEESMAIDLTTGVNVPRPNRRLTDFVFHNENGEPQPVEMMEVEDMFISGVILPLEETSDKEKEAGIQCNGFGRIESWSISGYEDGSPVIWVSTDAADYDCCKPAGVYKRLYGQFFEKAQACIEIYKRLSKSSGGDPDLTLDELLAAVLRSMSGSKNFPTGSSIKELVLSWGEFIYEQLTGLDGENFDELPVLAALRDESKRKADNRSSDKALSGEEQNNKSGEVLTQPTSSAQETLDKGDLKLARLLQENNDWKTLRQNKKQRHTNSTKKFYIRINEAEIANDYPLPAYYESSTQETDEYIICDCGFDVHDPDMLPRNMLHNWSLYNSDFRLIPLEVIPMTPCSDIDVTVFGSGIMTDDDGSGFNLDAESASNPSESRSEDGIPVFLSAIKEWMIEFGSSMVFITIRTDMGWYRLGKPAKEYAPWYEPVLKTARLSISIITLLKDQSRVSRLTFQEVVKRVAEYKTDHPAYISNNPAVVERYIVVHGQIILQQFLEYPDVNIQRCAFVSRLQDKMEERSHTRLLVKKRKIEQKERNLNPRGAMEPIVSKRKAMPATTTRLINRIWGDYYSNYLADEMEEDTYEGKKDDEIDEENEEEEIENATEDKYETEQLTSISKPKKSHLVNTATKWEGGGVGRTTAGKPLYEEVIVRGDVVALSGSVLVETVDSAECQSIYFVEYMYEESDGSKWIHGRLMLRACETVLGNTGNDREVFLTTKCMDFEVEDIVKPIVVVIRKMLWGHQHRKANADIERNDRLRAEDRKNKGLPMEYFCKSMYCSERGAFFSLPTDSMGLGKGVCQSCKMNDSEKVKKLFDLNKSMKSFRYQGTEFHVLDYLYVAPHQFKVDETKTEFFKGGKNIGLKAYVVCQFLKIEVPDSSEKDMPEYVTIKVRRFFRPEDLSTENAYSSDIREVYYSDQIVSVPVVAVEGKCEVRRRPDDSVFDGLYMFEHIFFCERQYDPQSGELKQLPIHIKLSGSKEKVLTDATSQKKRGKARSDSTGKQQDAEPKNCLSTLDIFAGCGGLSEGLQKSGASITKWAIEYEKPIGEAFNFNHPDAAIVVNNCNVILRAIMTASGDEDDCISTSDAADMAAELDETELKKLPKPGQVDFINGGPPCQGFSGMNRFNQSTWSKVQCEMILAFLSFVEYFRPKYFLLENVRNFVSFNKGQTFRLTLSSLLAMGYQVRFGILEAGAYGVSQSRKRAFIWAASPEEILPEWPEPMYVFAGPELKIPLIRGGHYAAARSTASGAPFRAITVKDTIGDLPAVGNGASETTLKYKHEPVSWYQKRIRGDSMVLTDHISKEMNELNLIRCQRIPKRRGADWRDLPDEKVRLTSGQVVDLIPWCLPNTAERHNQWKGLFGRLDWEGNFPTSVTDPQPMGKVGLCFHPDQDRILTVRECARSQGFPDSYKFAGNIHNKHRQIGNAVPPPLAFALGRKLKEAIDKKSTSANEPA